MNTRVPVPFAKITSDEHAAIGRLLDAFGASSAGSRECGTIAAELRDARNGGSVDGILAGLAEGKRVECARAVAIVEAWRDGNDPNGSDVAGLLATLRDGSPTPPDEAFAMVECPACKRPDGAVNHVPGAIFVGYGIGWQTCPDCDGTQRVGREAGGRAMRYLVITLDDAATIAREMDRISQKHDDAARIAARLRADTGADMQEIVDELTKLDTCAACEIEMQTGSCQSLRARALGRRLRRLLERARGERAPGDHGAEGGR